jgi:hypothetical protein
VTVYAPYEESAVQKVTPLNFAMERTWPSLRVAKKEA